mmetsp:Transcript_170198/g.545803  ORF Transcript_170198/g.545803 Transcript_170198/m.545803 type:complete len:470 (+) Transcript_170198:949-2358(+)
MSTWRRLGASAPRGMLGGTAVPCRPSCLRSHRPAAPARGRWTGPSEADASWRGPCQSCLGRAAKDRPAQETESSRWTRHSSESRTVARRALGCSRRRRRRNSRGCSGPRWHATARALWPSAGACGAWIASDSGPRARPPRPRRRLRAWMPVAPAAHPLARPPPGATSQAAVSGRASGHGSRRGGTCRNLRRRPGVPTAMRPGTPRTICCTTRGMETGTSRSARRPGAIEPGGSGRRETPHAPCQRGGTAATTCRPLRRRTASAAHPLCTTARTSRGCPQTSPRSRRKNRLLSPPPGPQEVHCAARSPAARACPPGRCKQCSCRSPHLQSWKWRGGCPASGSPRRPSAVSSSPPAWAAWMRDPRAVCRRAAPRRRHPSPLGRRRPPAAGSPPAANAGPCRQDCRGCCPRRFRRGCPRPGWATRGPAAGTSPKASGPSGRPKKALRRLPQSCLAMPVPCAPSRYALKSRPA